MLDFLALIPVKYRRWIYATIAFAAVVMAAWRASDGHWDEAIYILITSAFPTTLAGKHLNPDAPVSGQDSSASQ